MTAQLLAGSVAEYYGLIHYSWDEELGQLVGELGLAAEAFRSAIQADESAGLKELKDFIASLAGLGMLTKVDLSGLRDAMVADSKPEISLMENDIIPPFSANEVQFNLTA